MRNEMDLNKMKPPITSAQAMSHPAVFETVNSLGQMADELRTEVEALTKERDALSERVNLLKTTNEVLAEKLAAAETAHAAKLAYVRELEDANTPEITALTDRVKALEADAERYQWLSNYLISDDCQHDDAIVAARTVDQLNDVINRLREALYTEPTKPDAQKPVAEGFFPDGIAHLQRPFSMTVGQMRCALNHFDAQDDDSTEINILLRHLPAGRDTDGEPAPAGLYCWDDDLQDEGSLLLTEANKAHNNGVRLEAERVPLPDDLFSHKYAWLSALQIARDTALVDLPEIDDKSYWVHEIAVFQRVYAELEATHNIKES